MEVFLGNKNMLEEKDLMVEDRTVQTLNKKANPLTG